jgi:hypothetical protein
MPQILRPGDLDSRRNIGRSLLKAREPVRDMERHSVLAPMGSRMLTFAKNINEFRDIGKACTSMHAKSETAGSMPWACITLFCSMKIGFCVKVF